MKEKKKDYSLLFYEACRSTFGNRKGRRGEVEILHDDFSFPPLIRIDHPGLYLIKASDGIGTKIEIAERTGAYRTLAFDLLAMVCDDVARRGAEPVAVSEILDMGAMRPGVVAQLAEGLVEAAGVARVAVVAGEVAEMPERVSGYGSAGCNWAADAIGMARREELISGDEIAPGDSIVALREKGARSNGFTLIREILNNYIGDDWHEAPFQDKVTWGSALIEPSRIYTPLIVDYHSMFAPPFNMKGIAHITGGGIPEKMGRLLKRSRCGADLESLFEPCDIFQHLQEMGEIPDERAYGAWSMGNGMLIVLKRPEPFLEFAGSSGFDAKLAGRITDEGKIGIMSGGFYKKGKRLIFV